MATPEVQPQINPKTTERIAYRKQLEEQGIIYYNEDGESCVRPGVVPVETVLREVREGVHHID